LCLCYFVINIDDTKEITENARVVLAKPDIEIQQLSFLGFEQGEIVEVGAL